MAANHCDSQDCPGGWRFEGSLAEAIRAAHSEMDSDFPSDMLTGAKGCKDIALTCKHLVAARESGRKSHSCGDGENCQVPRSALTSGGARLKHTGIDLNAGDYEAELFRFRFRRDDGVSVHALSRAMVGHGDEDEDWEVHKDYIHQLFWLHRLDDHYVSNSDGANLLTIMTRTNLVADALPLSAFTDHDGIDNIDGDGVDDGESEMNAHALATRLRLHKLTATIPMRFAPSAGGFYRGNSAR